jgi:hypothetical protein
MAEKERDNAEEEESTHRGNIEAAIEEEFKKEIQVFERLIDSLKRITRQVDVPLAIGHYWSGYESEDPEEEYYSERGLVLADRFSERSRGNNPEGKYKGTRLCLTRSGKLIEIERSGFWSKREKQESSWSSTVMDITPAEAMAEYDLEEILDTVKTGMRISIERARKKQEYLGERLSELDEIAGGSQ